MCDLPLSPNELGDTRDDTEAQLETCAGCGEKCEWCVRIETCASVDGSGCGHPRPYCPACAAGYTEGSDGYWHPVDTRALRAEIAQMKAVYDAAIRLVNTDPDAEDGSAAPGLGTPSYALADTHAWDALVRVVESAEARRLAGMEVE
jgi:hypothetical protein